MQHDKKGPGRPSRQAIYRCLEEAIVELRDRLGGLPSPTAAEDIWTAIWYEEAHHSTALEGNTLVLKQVELFFAEGRAVGNKDLREYMKFAGMPTQPGRSTARHSNRGSGNLTLLSPSQS
jgi:cell filamentation protein, protein adenylyltransferase